MTLGPARIVLMVIGSGSMIVYVVAAAIGTLSVRKSMTVFAPAMLVFLGTFFGLFAIDFLEAGNGTAARGLPFFVYYLSAFLLLQVCVVLPLLLRAKRRMAKEAAKTVSTQRPPNMRIQPTE